MNEREFEVFTKGSLYDLVLWAELYLRRELPKENIVLTRFNEVLAEGWDESTRYLVTHVYEDSDRIKPSVDLVVDRFDDTTVYINALISGHQPREFCINWQNRAGPYLRFLNQSLMEYANVKFPDSWKL